VKFSTTKKYDNMLSDNIMLSDNMLSDNIMLSDNMLSDNIMLSDNMLSDITKCYQQCYQITCYQIT
jgi:hypothetical protein